MQPRILKFAIVLMSGVLSAAGCSGGNDVTGPTPPPVTPPPVSVTPPPAVQGPQTPTVPASYSGRCNDVQGTVSVATRNLIFSVWDSETIDGDIVSLVVNGSIMLNTVTLDGPGNKRSVSATMPNDGYNYIVLYAHNEGSLPPNTAALSVSDGRTTQNLVVSANLSTNGAYNVVVGSAPAPPFRAPCPTSPTTTTPPPSNGLVSMRWTLTDACNDGRGLQARFFDTTNRLQWPPDTSKVYVAASGGAIDVTLSAQAGAKVCFGAEPDPSNNRYWGVGIRNEQSCVDCCYSATTTSVSRTLTCQ